MPYSVVWWGKFIGSANYILLGSSQWIFLFSKIKLCLLWLLKKKKEIKKINNLLMLNVSIWENIWKWEVEVIYESLWEAKTILLIIILYRRLKIIWKLVHFLLYSSGTLFKEKWLCNLASLYYTMFQNSLLNIQNSFL